MLFLIVATAKLAMLSPKNAGFDVPDRLPENVVKLADNTPVENEFWRPPPLNPDVLPAMVLFTSVNGPWLSIPPLPPTVLLPEMVLPLMLLVEGVWVAA